MSYEGITEYLCPNGHYWTEDASVYMLDFLPPNACPHCGRAEVWAHDVDETNGMLWEDDGRPDIHSHRWPLEQLRYDDFWHKDHYGNDYATAVPVYRIPKPHEQPQWPQSSYNKQYRVRGF